MPKQSLAALIINWNGASDTLELIASLADCLSEDLAVSCVVVDNASSEADRAALLVGVSELSERVPVVTLLNSVNIGVPAAYNQAIQRAGLRHDYYLRLDNDVVVDPDGLLAMIDALRRDPSIGAVGGNVKFYHARDRNNGGAVSIDLARGRTRVTYPDENVICDGVLGCIMLIPASVIQRYTPEVFLGKLFICTDESELSLRLSQSGMKTLYLNQCIGFHKGGASTGKVKYLSQYYSIRNWTYLRLRYARRGWPKWLMSVEIAARTILNLVRWRSAYLRGVVAGICMWRTERVDVTVQSRHLGQP